MTNPEPAIHTDRAENTLHTMLERILNEEDLDAATTFAEAINLYIKSMRRRDGRIKFGPADVHGLLSIVQILITVPTLEDEIVKLYSGKKGTQDVQS